MTDVDINEKWFKALGWILKKEFIDVTHHIEYKWEHPTQPSFYDELPNPCQHYPDFKKWVLEPMMADGWRYSISYFEKGPSWNWHHPNDYKLEVKAWTTWQDFENNEILEAAVISATRYWESKK